MWHCRCDCGNEIDVSGQYLRNGRAKSCGCKRHRNTADNLVGQQFGKLVVLSREPNNKDGRSMWLCRCECGNEVVIMGKHLKSGNTKSCGCLKHKHQTSDISGSRFGRLVTEYIVSYNPVIYRCKCDCGNEVDVLRTSLVSGSTTSCGCYRKEYVSSKNINLSYLVRNDMPQWFIDDLAHDEDKLRARDRLITTNEKVDFYCPKHGIYKQEVSNHIRLGTMSRVYGCPRCSDNIAHSGSKDEIAIKDYIGIECVKDKSVLSGKEIDLYYADYNVGIEFNGSVYHATKGGVYRDLSSRYHRDKFLEAKEKGVHLISIFDVDWWNNQDKIKMYLDSIFKSKKSIYARKCEIKSITKELADEFTDKYHLQGRAKLNVINYGLYYNNKLLAVMSFGKYRLKKNIDGHYELHRYCVKDGITVVGGANKLLKAFEREYKPKELLSFSDNDYFSGGIYERLGFDNDGQATPRYYWFLSGVEIKREQCQLKKLKKSHPELLQEAYDVGASNKEDYVMLKLGARKVYRCGNTRWIKKY